MPLSNEARTALEESIKHWERLLACKTKEAFEREGYNGPACPLCRLYVYRDDYIVSCGNCPVREHTGKQGCAGTPYNAAQRAILAYRLRERMTLPRRQIKAELEFLKSLR